MPLNGNNRVLCLDPNARRATLVWSHSASATPSLLLKQSPQSGGNRNPNIPHCLP